MGLKKLFVDDLTLKPGMEILEDVAYVFAFLVLLGLMLMPYLARFF